MEIEFRSLSSRANKNEISALIQQCRQELMSRRAVVDRFRYAVDRASLLGPTKTVSKTEDDRARMNNTSQLHQQSTQSLQNSRRQLNDIENMGSDIMVDLRKQRDVLSHSKSALDETDQYLFDSRRVLWRMQQRTLFMKLLWCVVVIFLLLMICLIVYVKWIK
eukprot:TRINITY_DN1679_c0_g1_i4.p1 TRINITY_DN1679_c0_g1~~TRINITY_DN1679_c0_g1_i4.p1  ORF type:complete len:163 (-),score=31.47 TRINITY_DN1679_c0_g1_i4:179-667(-)